MAKKNEAKTYTSQAVVKDISASVKISVEINKTFYTIQYSETRSVPEDINVKLSKERQLLQDTVYSEVFNQIEEINALAKGG